ncbi:MAG: hypothetical protein WA991_05850, partial [Ornithinimicrobium sp.]
MRLLSGKWHKKPEAIPEFEETLFPSGNIAADDRSFAFDLYKLMVESSESLVGRRQAVNTFFLTANGVLVTVIGFFVNGGADLR